MLKEIKNTVRLFSTKLVWHQVAIVLFGLILYGNTLSHDYTQDDAIVIYDNMFTTQGLEGIPGLFKHDTFYGFFKEEGKAKLVAGGRYRPLTPMLFAIEYQLVGNKPWLGHLMNIIWFCLLGLMMFHVLHLLFSKLEMPHKHLFILMAVLLFIGHPIHTEVVANIKGRDEIIALLASLISLFASLKFHDSSRNKWLLLSFFSFFIGLLSKENTITFLAIIPVALYFFRSVSLSRIILVLCPLFVASILFILLRGYVIGYSFGDAPLELMNNPFLKWENGAYTSFTFSEKYATISYTLGKYLALLVCPHPLTHDYYPRQIEVFNFLNIKVILSLILNILLVIASLLSWKKNKIVSFSIIAYFASLSIVSNIVFPIGTTMSERFLFMPSFGFSILSAFLLHYFITKRKSLVALILFTIIISLYSIKTIQRNITWQDDYTLFTTDVLISTRSAKVKNAAGGALTAKAQKTENKLERESMLNQAIVYLDQAIEIHPSYKNAYLIKGNAHYLNGAFVEAVKNYEKALVLDPNYKEALTNLPVALRDAGRYFGEQQNNIIKATSYLKQSYDFNNNDVETARLLGICYGIDGNHKEAIKYFTKVVELSPNNAQSYVNLGTAFLNQGDKELAKINFEKAVEIDPSSMDKLNGNQ